MTNCVPAGGGGGSFLEKEEGANNPWWVKFRLIEVDPDAVRIRFSRWFKNWPSFHGYCFNCFAEYLEN